ncbi:probable protein phosphatase 2C 30 isoform X1 [Hibiscus syriacus]|uniref:probable protein phosphatase 2C 30 isoform X1 n=1 Tax=Hibiscus syriacus TaxID=106335 RepID=UPI0019233993|nr:probable protein phosphatase 2C 30 isoform X1 [Hibiscus syriacus]
MPWSLTVPSPILCKSDGLSFPSSPRINGCHSPSSPSSLPLCTPTSPLPLSSISVTTPLSPSSSSSLKSPLSLCIPKPPQFSLGADAAVPSLAKRKKPPMIEIPTPVAVKMGFAAVTPRGEEEVQVDGEGYSVYCKRGRRGKMEDRYSVSVDLNGDSKRALMFLQAFFGVFDGHGGSKAAEFVACNLDKAAMAEVSKRCGDAIEEALREAYLTTDMDFLKEDVGGGTCCVTAMIHKGDLAVSNAGDCRAVLSRNGVAEALTSDHHVSRQDERERIEALGGYVDFCHGVWRIQGSLAVSRAIGNKHLKKWVIAVPETKLLKIQPECEFLIMASDGLWNKVTNQEAVDLVRPFCVDVDKPEPFSACKKLAELSSWRGSFDDISVMIIQLERFVSGPV